MSFAIAGGIIGSAVIGGAASMAAAEEQGDAASQAAGMSQAQYRQSRSDLMPWIKGGGAANERLMRLLGIGPAYDENNPQARSAYEKMVSDYDAKHKSVYGVGIFDSSVDPEARARIFDGFKRQASESLGAPDDYGSLLDEFTGEDLQSEPGYEFGLAEGEKAINRAAAGRGSYDSGATLKALARYTQDYAGTKYNDAFNRNRANKSDVYGMLSGQSGQGVNAAGMTAGLGANATSNAGNALMQGADAGAAGIVGGANALTSGVGNYLNYNQNNKVLDYLRKGSVSSFGQGTDWARGIGL